LSVFLDITLFDHVARKGEKRNAYWVFVGKPEGKRPSEDRGVDGRTNIKTAVWESPGDHVLHGGV